MDNSIRYSRQLTLTGWGQTGQARLADATVLIVGLGGIGVPAATYLAAAGTGRLVLNDFDTVDESNLGRQPLYTDADVGQPKVAVAASALRRLNPGTATDKVDRRLDAEALRHYAGNADVVVDCSDNFGTRFAVNRACVATATPLVSAAAIRFEAQLAVFRPDLAGTPCYRCLYDEQGDELEDCRGQGVMSPLVGMIGSAAALEAIRIIIGLGEPLHSKLLVCDTSRFEWRTIGFGKDPACPVCADAQNKRQENSVSN